MESEEHIMFRSRKLAMVLSCIAVSIFSFNCSMSPEQFDKSHWNEETQGPIPTFAETNIEELDLQMLPDSGAYYLYHESDYNDNLLSPEKKLRRLYVLGFNITMAWYRQPTGGCNKPGTTLVTKTVYPEFFLIRLPKANELIEEYNFRFIDKPEHLPCPYNISLYTPVFK
ncbi:MAG: hypothetical protein Q8N83_13990 [Ignavibacteria bacterium]|nr:hypothetical protein [Ignavibacteria bacterium]